MSRLVSTRNRFAARPHGRLLWALGQCAARPSLAFLRWLWRTDNAARWTAFVLAIVISYIAFAKLGVPTHTRATLTRSVAVALLFYTLSATLFGGRGER